jgi:hypothetical protein
MKIAHAVSAALILSAGAWNAFPAAAQTLPNSAMLVPGVYTTPEISAKCQAYAAKRVPVAGADQQRQSVAVACVKKLYNQEVAKQKKSAS